MRLDTVVACVVAEPLCVQVYIMPETAYCSHTAQQGPIMSSSTVMDKLHPQAQRGLHRIMCFAAPGCLALGLRACRGVYPLGSSRLMLFAPVSATADREGSTRPLCWPPAAHSVRCGESSARVLLCHSASLCELKTLSSRCSGSLSGSLFLRPVRGVRALGSSKRPPLSWCSNICACCARLPEAEPGGGGRGYGSEWLSPHTPTPPHASMFGSAEVRSCRGARKRLDACAAEGGSL